MAESSRKQRRPASASSLSGVLPSGITAPHSEEAEQALLGICILEGGDYINDCLKAKVAPDSFYQGRNQILFETLTEVYHKRQALDSTLLIDALREKDQLETVGGLAYINQLMDRITTVTHFGHYLDIVCEKATLRRLIRTCSWIVEECHKQENGIDHFVGKVEEEIFRVSDQRTSSEMHTVESSVKEAMLRVEQFMTRKGAVTGVPSGFTELDKMTSGFQKNQLIILAARPSMGKTSLALNIAENNVAPMRPDNKPVPTLIFSLEMGHEELAMRLLCSNARVSMGKLRDGFLDAKGVNALQKSANVLSKAPLLIDDSSSLTILELRAKARRLHTKHKLGLIIVDYLQLINGSDPRVPREQQIAEISRGLKGMAKELGLPVIVLSQLNRESEKGQRLPRLSDLRESGSIEQDADIVLMLSKSRKDLKNDEVTVVGDTAELIIAKQRNGPVGSVPLAFLREITRFETLSHVSE
jgi:replicative DNA helicase